MNLQNILSQILPFILTLLSSFLIAYLTSRLCFWLYGKIREALKIDDTQKVTPEDIKKWLLFLISTIAFMLPSFAFRFIQKGNHPSGWMIGFAGLTGLMITIVLIQIFVKKRNLEEIQE